jgi:phosphoenolpyruvate synthase/pyruvate phosphate dikinase
MVAGSKMMGLFVVALDDAGRAEVSRVGRKAATLCALLNAGFPVPRGVCVTVDAFDLALAKYKAPIDAILRQHAPLTATPAQAAADEITRLLAGLTLPQEIASALRTAFRAALPDVCAETTPLAIRSSAVDEDGLDVSFAGQYSSVIGVHGEDAVQMALMTCWRSFFGANALLARATHRPGDAFGGMAVVIQPVIQAECAGVCFSVDPVQQRRDQVLVNAAWGLGAGVVDGSVATDTARVRWEDLSIAEHHINVKQEQIILNQGGGLRRAAVLPDRQRVACMPDAWIVRVAQYGIAAELLFERPQDLEWAVAEDRLWVLQSRRMIIPWLTTWQTPWPASLHAAPGMRLSTSRVLLRRLCGRDGYKSSRCAHGCLSVDRHGRKPVVKAHRVAV